jgi:hypothetical protein
MSTLQRSIAIAVLIISLGIIIYEAHRASALESELQVLRGQDASLAAQAQEAKNQRDDTEHRPVGAEPNSKLSNADRSELLRLRGEVGLLRRQLAAVEASPGPATNHMTFPGLYLQREAWSDHGTDKPQNTILSMFWALRQGDQSKLEQMVSTNGGKTLGELIFRRDDWEKISAIQVANTVVVSTASVDTATVEVIVEQAPPAGQTDKDVSMHRWTLVKMNDQWLILN